MYSGHKNSQKCNVIKGPVLAFVYKEDADRKLIEINP